MPEMWIVALIVLFFKCSVTFDMPVTAVELLRTGTIPSAVKQLRQISFQRYKHVPGPVI